MLRARNEGVLQLSINDLAQKIRRKCAQMIADHLAKMLAILLQGLVNGRSAMGMEN